MAAAVVTSGTSNPVVGTETSLSTQTPSTPTTYVVRVDGSALVAGETATVRIYTITLNAGAEAVEQQTQIVGGSAPEVWVSSPCLTDISIRVSITQEKGTGRAFPWKLFLLG